MNNSEKIYYTKKCLSTMKGEDFGPSEIQDAKGFKVPTRLFHYAKLDGRTLESLSDGKIFLSPLCGLNDRFEGSVGLGVGKIGEASFARLGYRIRKKILKYIVSSTPNVDVESFWQASAIVPADPLSDLGWVGKAFSSHPEMFPGGQAEASKLLSFLSSFEKGLETSNDFKTEAEEIMRRVTGYKSTVGVFCLSETGLSQSMWQNYAGRYSGVCVEYDFEPYMFSCEQLSPFPVVYRERGRSNLVGIVTNTFVLALLDEIFGKKDDGTLSYLPISPFLVKSPDWSFEKEWRIVGTPSSRIVGPRIASVILGSQADSEYSEKVIKMAEEGGFIVKHQGFDFEKLKISMKRKTSSQRKMTQF